MENLARRRGVPLELDDLASHVTDFALDIYEIALAEDPDMTLVRALQFNVMKLESLYCIDVSIWDPSNVY